jgi:DNA repair exonuclease SbcCD ATPase subunit
LQAYIDDALKGRIEREQTKAAKDREKAEKEAARKALEDQEKFRELYEAEKTERERLESESERLSSLEEAHSTYKDTVASIADARMESLNLPKGVKALVEGMEPAERLSWLQENEADFSGSTETVPESPNGTDNFSSPEADEKARADFAHAEASKF